jgi:hypothetical protein
MNVLRSTSSDECRWNVGRSWERLIGVVKVHPRESLNISVNATDKESKS